MASKSDNNVVKPSKGRAPRKTSAQAAAPAPAPAKQAGGAKSLLRAGLKALNEVRDDVITRQSRVFEALLGIDTSQAASRTPKEASLLQAGEAASGVQKFEEVFDQRVARALERLGMPSPQALATLCQQLDAINDHLQRIKPSPPAKKRTARRRPTRS